MCNKKSLFGGDAKEEVKVQETESTNLESDDSELEYNDPDYNNYEDVINENVLEKEEPMEVFEQPENLLNKLRKNLLLLIKQMLFP